MKIWDSNGLPVQFGVRHKDRPTNVILQPTFEVAELRVEGQSNLEVVWYCTGKGKWNTVEAVGASE